MTIDELVTSAKTLAGRFRSNPAGFFKALRAKSNGPFPGCVEREYRRYVAGNSKFESLQPIFETIHPSAATAAITSKVETDPQGATVDAMEHLASAVTKVNGAIDALEAKTAAEQVGLKTLDLLSHPSKKVSEPIKRGIEKAVAACEKLTLSQFRALSNKAKWEAMRSGTKLVDDTNAPAPRAAKTGPGAPYREDATPAAVAEKTEASRETARQFIWCTPATRHMVIRDLRAIGQPNLVSEVTHRRWEKERREFCERTSRWPEEIHGSPKLEIGEYPRRTR